MTERVLSLEEVAAVMGLTPTAIYNRLSRGTFLPVPCAKYPYRWSQEEIEKWKRGEYRAAEDKLREQARQRRSKSRTEAA